MYTLVFLSKRPRLDWDILVKPGLEMRRIIWVSVFCCCIVSVAGCHYNGHDDSGGNSVDGTKRRKRTSSLIANQNITVIGYFPTCIERRLNESTTNSTSKRRAWKGPVSYIVYHSRWYRKVNQTCWGGNDTVECWMNNIVNVLRGQSRTLRAAQECVVDYYDEYFGVETTVDVYPGGTTFEDSGTCETVDVELYQQQILPFLNSTAQLGSDDVAFTVEYIDDVLDFAKEDLYCPDCSCDDLAEATEYFEAFEFNEGSCSSCWYTTFATEITDDTELWDEISELTFTVAGFRQKQTCPVDYGIDFSADAVIKDLVRINISCGLEQIVIDMKSCGLVQLGYRKADEVFVANPNTPIADIYTIPSACISKIKKQTDNEVTTINFRRHKCSPEISTNATHETYNFALRNRRPATDPYATEIQIDRRVYIDFRFTCTYPLLNEPVGLPLEITALQRSIQLYLEPSEDPLQVTMSAFRDEDFEIPFSANDSSVIIPDPIWMKVTHNGPKTTVVDIPSCWLEFPGAGTVGELTIYLLLDGCPFKENNGTGSLDGVYSLSTCSSNVASFMFFSFYYANHTLHIECDVNVYEETPQICQERACGNAGTTSRRRRRSAAGRLSLVIEPHIRECKVCEGFCNCDGVCGCDNAGKPLCFCP